MLIRRTAIPDAVRAARNARRRVGVAWAAIPDTVSGATIPYAGSWAARPGRSAVKELDQAGK